MARCETVPGICITERALESNCLRHTRLTPPPTTISNTSCRSCSSPPRVGMAGYGTCTFNGEECACLGKFSTPAGLDTKGEVASPTPIITTSFTTCLHFLESIRNVQGSSRSRKGTVTTGDAANCSKSATTQVQFQTLTHQTHISNHCLPISVMGKVFMKGAIAGEKPVTKIEI